MLNFLGASRDHGRSAVHTILYICCGNHSASSVLDVDFCDRSDKFASTSILRGTSIGGGDLVEFAAMNGWSAVIPQVMF